MTKLKESYETESGTRKRWYNYYTCDHCGLGYRKQKRFSEGALMEHFCSKKCYHAQNSTADKVELVCAHCSITFNRPKSKLISKSGLYFCCREHKDIGQTYIKEIQPAHYGTAELTYREKAFKFLPNKCNECGYSNINALEVHHKDKDRSNNDISNLEVLCCNCHTLEHRGLRTGVQRYLASSSGGDRYP